MMDFREGLLLLLGRVSVEILSQGMTRMGRRVSYSYSTSWMTAQTYLNRNSCLQRTQRSFSVY